MKDAIKLHEICGYLPYGLKMRFENGNGREITLTGINGGDGFAVRISDGRQSYWLDDCGFKPVLRTLSDLTKEIEHNGKKFVPWIELEMDYREGYNDLVMEFNPFKIGLRNKSMGTSELVPYELIQKLFEWHFDVFGLLDRNLAVNLI